MNALEHLYFTLLKGLSNLSPKSILKPVIFDNKEVSVYTTDVTLLFCQRNLPNAMPKCSSTLGAQRVGGHMFCKYVLRIHAPVTPRRMQPYTVPAIQRPMNRSQKGGRQLQLASTARQMSYWYTCNISIRGKYTRCNGSMASKMGIHLWYCVTRQTGTNSLNTGTLH